MPISTHSNANQILKPVIRRIRPNNSFRNGRAIDIEDDKITQSYWEAVKSGKSCIEQKLQLESCLRHRRLSLQDIFPAEPFRVCWLTDQ